MSGRRALASSSSTSSISCAVVHEKAASAAKLAVDQGVADEQLARLGGMGTRVVDAFARLHDQAVERELVEGTDARGALFPVRLEDVVLEQVRAELFDPFRLDAGDGAGVGARGLGDLRGHQPLGAALVQTGAGKDMELAVARAEIGVLVALVLGLEADVREQAGEQRAVDGIVLGRLLVLAEAHLGELTMQLAVGLAPLAQAHPRQELALTELAQLRLGVVLGLLVVMLPELEVGEEVGAFVVEALVRLVGGLLAVGGTFARVLHGQRGDDDQRLAQRALALGGEQHAAQARIDRQPRQAPADVGQAVVRVHRVQLFEQQIAVLDQARIGRIDEREIS